MKFIRVIICLVIAMSVFSSLTSFAAELPEIGVSAEYIPSADVSKGEADGVINVSFESEVEKGDLYSFWGDKDGNKLSGYTFLTKQKVNKKTEAKIKIPANTVIPEGAESIIVYVKSGAETTENFVIKLPENAKPVDRENILFDFQVCSDIHIDREFPTYTEHLNALLDDIAVVAPDSKGVMVVGDISNHGYQEEYDLVKEVLAGKPNHPEMHYVKGNHDVSYGKNNPTFNAQMKIFNKFSGNKSLYYDLWINECHFIFLATDEKGCPTSMPDEEIEWLRETIKVNASPDRPIFVFCHESIQDTVAGSSAAEKWWGIKNGDKVAEILKDYPQACFFTGHSHWILSSKNEMYPADQFMCNAFNTSSLGYLWTGYNIVEGESEEGAEAIYVEVYKDKVLVRGRDVENGQWIGAA